MSGSFVSRFSMGCMPCYRAHTMDRMEELRTELGNPLLYPRIGAKLLKDPRGNLPLAVFAGYVHKQIGHYSPLVDTWTEDPFDPVYIHRDPQEAVDEVLQIVVDVREYVESGNSGFRAKALAALDRAYGLLLTSSTQWKRGRGQPSTMRHVAVRAYVIRKFNPDPAKPGESTVRWAKLADMLFENEGKCSRCRVDRHQYDSACVKTLMAAVGRLKAAMRQDGIPV
jgi:hypothetical protein